MKKVLLLLLFISSGSALAQGTIVVAGGGAEGDQGDTAAWSYHLYKRFLENGDADADGVIRVAILTESLPNQPADANWLPDYFEWIGTTLSLRVQATNYEVAGRADAESAGTVGGVADADVVFIKGGDQGAYYDLWNGTLLETHIRAVAARGGAVGGTSAGAMSMAEYCFSGSMDMISDDVLADSHTSYLDDNNDGGSGVHTDFLSFLPGIAIDSHFTERGRLGRMAGFTARAAEDHNDHGILAIGLERKTGLAITNGVAEVIGIGAVTFLRESAQTTLIREPGKPLYYTELIIDRLTEGWTYDLTQRTPITGQAPAGTVALTTSLANRANSGALSLSGSNETDAGIFGHTGDYYPDDYARVAGTADPYIRDSAGFTDAGNSNSRADKHETLYRLLYDVPEDIGFLVYSGGNLSRTANEPDVIRFDGNASLVIDTAGASQKGLSPHISNWASSGGNLRAASFVGARLHIMADSSVRETGYDTRTHAIVPVEGGGNQGGNGIAEIEPNDSRGTAQDLTGESWPISITGTIATVSDRDYFEIHLQPGDTLTANLTVPADVDYDLYLLDKRGRTVVRSINDGNGLDESLSYTLGGRRAKTFYVEVESYSGSSTTGSYTLDLSQ